MYRRLINQKSDGLNKKLKVESKVTFCGDGGGGGSEVDGRTKYMANDNKELRET